MSDSGVIKVSTRKGELYYCEVCGVVVEVKKGGDGSLFCCNQMMTIKEDR